MTDDPLGLAGLPKVKVPAAETPRPEALLGLATGVVIVSALYFAREVLIPITLAIFLSFFLAPVVKLLQRARLPKVMAVILAVAMALAVILLVGAVIASQLKALIGNLPEYVSTVNDKIESVHRVLNSVVTQVTGRLGTLHQLPTSATGPAAPEPEPIPVVIESSSTSYLETGREILEPILSPLATLAIVLIVTIFILVRQEDLRDRLIRLFGSNDLHRTTLCRINHRRPASDRARRGDRSGLVDCALDSRAFHRRRRRNRAGPRARALRQQHRTVADGGHRGRHLLELDLGTYRPDPVHASYAVSGRCRTPRAAS
jgi:hypothetical protein